MKIGLAAASLVLVAGGATACSNDASEKEFCDGYEDFISALVGIDQEGDNFVEDLKEAASDFEEVGVPGDIPDDAKDGRDLVLETIADLDDDATPQDVQELDKDFSEDEQEKADAFEKYLEDTCPNAGESLQEDGGGE